MTKWIPLVALALGCKDFTSVDEACSDGVPGDGQVSDPAAIDVTARTNCYRRLAGLGRGNLHEDVQHSVEAHLTYMAQNQVHLTYAAFSLEDSALPGYTGADVYDRAEAADYTFDDLGGWGVWEVGFFYVPLTREERIEYYFPDPFMRQIVLQPDWVDSGYAETFADDGTPLAYWAIFYNFPNLEHDNRPVVYPKDGQVDVPFRYRSDTPGDSIYPLGEVGLPITLTFGTYTEVGFSTALSNPYGVAWRSAELVGPDGPVELALITPPGADLDLLRYTLVAVPTTPLKPSAEYTFTAEVTWGDGSDAKVDVTYTTAAEDDFRWTFQDGQGFPAARQAPPFVRHTPPRDLLAP